MRRRYLEMVISSIWQLF